MQKTDSRISEQRAIWGKKAGLREVYADLYRRIIRACGPGIVVEIGGGSGNLREFFPAALSFDIVPLPWLDFVADAQRLPFCDNSIGNLVMFDVLHHIEFPTRFFAEATRVLTTGGRIVMIEPGVTLVSWLFYHFVHDEPVDMSVDPLQDGEPDSNKDPFVGNQAIPTLLVTRYAHAFQQQFPSLRIAKKEWLSLFCYPLSGGFKPWSLVTPQMAKALLQLENVLIPVFGRVMGFRIFVILEKLTKSVDPSRDASGP